MEKEGFIYIWFDKKRKMYYIGCHWGTENDGYICSSNRMRDAYRRRPSDFKRRFLTKKIKDRNSLLEEEYRWLSLIEDSELGKKYYNLRKHQWGHWSTDKKLRDHTLSKLHGNKNRLGKSKGVEEIEKIRKALTGRKRSVESIEKQRQALLGRKQSAEHIAKKIASNMGKKRAGQALINMQSVAKKMRASKKVRYQLFN